MTILRNLSAGVCLLAASGCGLASAEASEPERTNHEGALSRSDPGTWVADTPAGLDETGDEAPPTPRKAALDVPLGQAAVVKVAAKPLETRIARQNLTVFTNPTVRAPIRGRIPIAKAFDVFGYVDGPDCDGELGWADVGNDGFACMAKTRAGGARQPKVLPRMRSGITPYYYAKVAKGNTAPRFKNLRALHDDAEPVGRLHPHVDYAFTNRRISNGQVVLLDAQKRAVREADVIRFRPSRFRGRDLEAQPIPAQQSLAWISNWPQAPLYAVAEDSSEIVGGAAYHDQVLLAGSDKEGWEQLENGLFIRTADVRKMSMPSERPSNVGEHEVWIDIDLETQVFVAVRGDTPILGTLVSSGFKSPTPRGIFRIHNKLAIGGMSSSPGASDVYDVQAVPHVQYFVGGFALHSAYWHDYFGRPISHGCVNLSPLDAKRVFSLTSPSLPGGWLHAYESEESPGTTVRIHRGGEQVRDRRQAVEPVFGR